MKFIILFLVSIISNYVKGFHIERTRRDNKDAHLLSKSIIADVNNSNNIINPNNPTFKNETNDPDNMINKFIENLNNNSEIIRMLDPFNSTVMSTFGQADMKINHIQQDNNQTNTNISHAVIKKAHKHKNKLRNGKYKFGNKGKANIFNNSLLNSGKLRNFVNLSQIDTSKSTVNPINNGANGLSHGVNPQTQMLPPGQNPNPLNPNPQVNNPHDPNQQANPNNSNQQVNQPDNQLSKQQANPNPQDQSNQQTSQQPNLQTNTQDPNLQTNAQDPNLQSNLQNTNQQSNPQNTNQQPVSQNINIEPNPQNTNQQPDSQNINQLLDSQNINIESNSQNINIEPNSQNINQTKDPNQPSDQQANPQYSNHQEEAVQLQAFIHKSETIIQPNTNDNSNNQKNPLSNPNSQAQENLFGQNNQQPRQQAPQKPGEASQPPQQAGQPQQIPSVKQPQTPQQIEFPLQQKTISQNMTSTLHKTNSPSITDKEITIILSTHNTFRDIIATGKTGKTIPFATNMLQMYWDDVLAKKAQEWANNNKFEQSNTTLRNHAIMGLTGENIFMISTTTVNKPFDWKSAITAWYNEINELNVNDLDKFVVTNTTKTGQFTQLAWAKSYLIGCGQSTFKFGNKYNQLYVCHYAYSGNVLNNPVYHKADAQICNCPKNTACKNDKFIGLCCPVGYCTESSLRYPGPKITFESDKRRRLKFKK